MALFVKGRADHSCVDLSGATVAELNAELVRRTAGVEALDNMFTLPDWVRDPNLRTGYEVIVARLRREASHVQMNTVQTLLLERIAFNYIVLRFKERAAIGSDEGFSDPKVIKDFNTFWLAMTKEFNDLLAKYRPIERDAIMGLVRNAVADVMAKVEDGALRNALIEQFVAVFRQYQLIDA